MPLDLDFLVAVSHMGGRNMLWTYRTDDTEANILAGNYFNGASSRLTPGDLILASVDTDGTPTSRMAVVASNDGATVVVTKSSIA